MDGTGFEPVFPQVINHGACQLAEPPGQGLPEDIILQYRGLVKIL